MDRSRLGLLVAGLVGCTAVACGGSDDTTSASTTTELTTTTVTAPQTTEPETTTTEAAGQADVQLDFTGTYVLQIHGQYGECTGANGTFGFSMNGDDVDGIGEGFSVEQLGSTDGDIEWVIDDLNAYGSSESAILKFSADGRSVGIDDDLAELTEQPAGTAPRPEHVTGTITCP